MRDSICALGSLGSRNRRQKYTHKLDMNLSKLDVLEVMKIFPGNYNSILNMLLLNSPGFFLKEKRFFFYRIFQVYCEDVL